MMWLVTHAVRREPLKLDEGIVEVIDLTHHQAAQDDRACPRRPAASDTFADYVVDVTPLLEEILTSVADQIPADVLEQLRHALAVLIGVASMGAGDEESDADDPESRADLAWACRTLVMSALADSEAPARQAV